MTTMTTSTTAAAARRRHLANCEKYFPTKKRQFLALKICFKFFIDNRFTEDMFDASLPSSIQTVLWQSTKPWSSLVEGDEGCRGPSGKLLCLRQSQ